MSMPWICRRRWEHLLLLLVRTCRESTRYISLRRTYPRDRRGVAPQRYFRTSKSGVRDSWIGRRSFTWRDTGYVIERHSPTIPLEFFPHAFPHLSLSSSFSCHLFFFFDHFLRHTVASNERIHGARRENLEAESRDSRRNLVGSRRLYGNIFAFSVGSYEENFVRSFLAQRQKQRDIP